MFAQYKKRIGPTCATRPVGANLAPAPLKNQSYVVTLKPQNLNWSTIMRQAVLLERGSDQAQKP